MNRLILALAIWFVFGVVCLISERVHAGSENGISSVRINKNSLRNSHLSADLASKEITHSDTVKPIPPGLQRIMAEGAGRVVNPTCDDVRAVVAWIGEARAVEMARDAGASNSQIDKARRCLK